MSTGRDEIDRLQQREQFLRLIRRVARDILRRRERVGGRNPSRRRGEGKELLGCLLDSTAPNP
jgi:hypothetical protein